MSIFHTVSGYKVTIIPRMSDSKDSIVVHFSLELLSAIREKKEVGPIKTADMLSELFE